MSVPDHLKQWVMALSPAERELIQLLLDHANSKGLSAMEMAENLEQARDLFQAMHDARGDA